MRKDTLSAALDLLGERHIAYVTVKKPRSTVTASISDGIIVTEPSFWRKLGNAAAVVVFVTILTIAFIMMRRSVGPGITPGDTLTDTTDEVTTTETIEDTTDTEPIETETDTEPVTAEPITVSGVTYELRDGGYVVTGVTSETANRAALVDKIDETPVIGIADGAFDSVSDPLNFRIFGYDGTFARDYAVENGHIFIEYFNGNLPNHYYPEGVYLHEWKKNEPDDICIAVDDNAEIDKLVADYINGKDTYGEILERVLYRMVCLDRFNRWYDSYWNYYITDDPYSYNEGDYDRYVVYLPPEAEGDWLRDFEQGAFGKIESYSELTENVKLLSQNKFYWLSEIQTAEDYMFMPLVGSGTLTTLDANCSLEITADSIIISIEYTTVTKTKNDTVTFERTDDGWGFRNGDGLKVSYSNFLYRYYCGELRNKYNKK